MITTLTDGACSVYAADLDGDGDEDVLSASGFDGKIRWYESKGRGDFAAAQLITTQANGAHSVYTADLDGDGDQDVLSASDLDNTIAWYENLTDVDATPPMPDPSTWQAEPYAAGAKSIRMVATAANDPSGGEYYFDETSGNSGGTDSGWQDSNIYQDTGLPANTSYTYQVRTRDKSPNQNTGSYSLSRSATTAPVDDAVDLLGTFFDAEEPLTAGQTFEATYEILNAGTGPSGVFAVEWYISQDSTIEASDEQLDRAVFVGLSGGASTVRSTRDLDLPAQGDAFWNGDGTYYIGMVIDPDGIVQETNKTNNANRGDGLDRDSVWVESADNDAPSIGSLSDSPDPATPPNNLTLTANSVSDSDGTVSKVEFYWDSNGNGSLNVGTDQLLGTDTSSGGGWKWAGATGGFPTGTNRYFARAQDNDGAWSNVVTTTGTVNSDSVSQIIDDGDGGFAGGGFTPFSGQGYGGDCRYAAAAVGM